MPLTADDIRKLLRLEPLPGEGGYFREMYRSALVLPKGVLPPWYSGERNAGTSSGSARRSSPDTWNSGR